MLSTNSTSSISKRRQQHRRQQSLEVPILATPLPANPRRTNKPATQGLPGQGHKRGLSLDQALDSPSGFRQLLPQDQGHSTGTPPVRIQLDPHTNTGHPPDPQHFVQETQQHTPAQPGYQAQDFQSHLQQQLKGNNTTNNNNNTSDVGPAIVAPIPTHPNQEQALQELQHHLEWYQQQFGHSPAANLHTVNQPASSEMAANNRIDTRTPVSQAHSRTVPNTPQHYAQSWPSPPPTDAKIARSQSFQLDVAPMHMSMASSSPYSQPMNSFGQDSFDQGYASSVYSSSLVDPMSPGRQTTMGQMPTLFEEAMSDSMPEGHVLLHATAGASDDFNSPNFIVGGPVSMSPHSAMMWNLADDVNATIIDTGITPEHVDSLISEQSPNKLWHCEFIENGEKCDKEFKRKENARSHVQNHLGDRQFQCNDCGKTFVRQHDMKRHAAIHKDDRPHICPCGNGFARHDALTRHRQRGMCVGTLPGYEKSEEDKPKRGRPRKERRPDMDTRTTKAGKARQMDRENGEAGEGAYATSTSSALSERSLPATPPDTSDFDADAFINMANVEPESGFTWRDTPPTSPAMGQDCGISPQQIMKGGQGMHTTTYGGFEGASSPDHGGFSPAPFNFGLVEAEPDVATTALFSDAFTGSCGGSIAASSPPGGADDLPENVSLAPGWGDMISPRPDDFAGLAMSLDRWLATN